MFLLLIAIFWSNIGYGHIYEYINNRHEIIFSDRFPGDLNSPAKTFRPAILNSTMTTPADDLMGNGDTNTDVKFISPSEQQTFWNPEEILVELQNRPKLNEGESLQIVLDQTPVRIPIDQNRISLKGVTVGTHCLEAKVIGKEPNITKTATKVTFFVHRGAAPESH